MATERPRKIDTKTLLRYSPLFMPPAAMNTFRSESAMIQTPAASFNIQTSDKRSPYSPQMAAPSPVYPSMNSAFTSPAAPMSAAQTPSSSSQSSPQFPSTLASSPSYSFLSSYTSFTPDNHLPAFTPNLSYLQDQIYPAPQTSTPQHQDTCFNRLQSNPMFNDLKQFLSQECRHLQVPASLITASWNQAPSVVDTSTTVVSLHSALQDEFLRLHADISLRHDTQHLERYYSTEVGRIEMERYQSLQTPYCPEQQRASVNTHYDNERISLCHHLQREIQHLRNTKAAMATSSVDRMSPISDVSEPVPSPLQSATASFSIEEFLSPTLSPNQPVESPVYTQSATPDSAFSSRSVTPSTSRDSGIHSQESSPEITTSAPSPAEPAAPEATTVGQTGRLMKSETTRVLTEWYEAHINYPYPSDDDVKTLSEKAGIKPVQVRKWLANKRVRSFNTLSISGNDHPIKYKYQGRQKNADGTTTSRRSQYKLLTPAAKKILTDWYDAHQQNPYPTEEEKEDLAELAQVSTAQVKSWFANKRSRNNNTRKQVPNYFIKKYPSCTPIVEMVGNMRAAKKQKFNDVRMSLFQ